MNAPVWQGATTGSNGAAGQVNQFLAAHAVTYLYQGKLQSSQQTAGGSGINSTSLWLAQKFTMPGGVTASGYVMIRAAIAAGSPPVWPVTLQADNSGAPSGTPLVSASLPKEFLSLSLAWIPVPLPVTGLTPGAVYWIVAQQAGDSGNHYDWFESNQTSGASTSSNGSTWAAQTFGFMYQFYDQAATLPLAGTFEDSGARWTWLSYTAGALTGVQEYTAGQTAAGYTAASRTLSYSGTLLTGVA